MSTPSLHDCTASDMTFIPVHCKRHCDLRRAHHCLLHHGRHLGHAPLLHHLLLRGAPQTVSIISFRYDLRAIFVCLLFSSCSLQNSSWPSVASPWPAPSWLSSEPCSSSSPSSSFRSPSSSEHRLLACFRYDLHATPHGLLLSPP